MRGASPGRKARGVFVTGTDTGVGKTVVGGDKAGTVYEIKVEADGHKGPPIKVSPDGTVEKRGPGEKGPKPKK